MTTHTQNNLQYQGPPAETYDGLVSSLPPRPLHDETDYDNAVEMLGNLIGFDLNADQEDYLVALSTFVEKYEDEHPETQWNLDHLTGLDMLRSLLKDHGMSGADLSRLLGVSRAMGPMLLRGERAITASHARVLGKHFALDPGAFIR